MSLSRIAVGVDFSPESLRAVDHAMAVARHTGAAVTLVHVGAVPPSVAAGNEDPWVFLRESLAADRARLEELRGRLAGQGVEVSHVVRDGFADPGLVDGARDLDAGLIVVGTHGRSGIRRLLLGSVAEKTLRLAETSVLVARGDAVPGGYRRVVVGTDFSPIAWRALERALELTAPGGDVRVVHVWRAPYVEYDLDGRVLASLREAAEVEAGGQREKLFSLSRPPRVTIQLDVVDGVPFDALDRLSGEADLLVVGSHGRRGVRRLVLGSVAEATVRHASCSVLVAR